MRTVEFPNSLLYNTNTFLKGIRSMNIYKQVLALLLSVIFIIGLTACNGSDKSYIYFTLTEPPSTLDPQTAKTDTELMLVRNIFEGLLRKDENGKIVCGAAESYKKDGLVYTFKLKKDIIWSNEIPVTAHDFVFALKRAVNPKTAAPYAKRLSGIKNAEAILKGKKNTNELGVKALDKHTLQIELTKNDENFEETLTTAIAMPCNEAFFYSTSGKYGIEKETTLSNGSYRLAKWGKEIFGIRLYRNDYYKGDFRAKNAAVFLTLSGEQTPLELLKSEDADIAFINASEIDAAKATGLNTVSYNSTCWYLTISDGFSKDIRKALISLANPKIFSKSLTTGYYPATSIYPKIIHSNTIKNGMPSYNLKNAKKLFADAVDKLKDKKFPTDVVLYYYDDGVSKNVVTDIVGHWQNQLGAFVNIESVSSPSILTSQLKDQTYALTIFSLSANSSNVDEYLQNFGINYKDESLSKTQQKLLKSKNIVPLMTQDTIIAYGNELRNVILSNGNCCIDFAYIIKDT